MRYVLLPAHNPTPYTGPTGNNTYLIAGREPALIDAGIGDPRHLDDLARALSENAGVLGSGRSLARVLVTHGHSDHASGCEAIAARWPGVVFVKMPWPDRDHRYPVRWNALRDDDLVPAGDGLLRAVHTPGHAPDHVCLFDEGTKTLFAGDLVASGTTVVIPAAHGGSLSQYLRSLERVRALKPARLLPAHGPAIDDPARLIRLYLAHRLRREAEVLAALGDGCRTLDTIVARVYAGLAADLVGAARETVLAHLIKLESEGRVARHGDEWSIEQDAFR